MEDLIIMYSGGLDSFIMSEYAKFKGFKNPTLIYIDLGHPYSEEEKKRLHKDVIIFELHIYQKLKKRLSNQIIPSRNLLLATIGGMFGSRVWIGALDGEQKGKERDKSDEFFKRTKDLLTFTNNFFQPKTIVEAPFRHLTKSEIIKWAIENNVSAKSLLSTRSCYSGAKTECGQCLTCVKRHIAFALNNIDDGNWESVKGSDYFQEISTQIPIAAKRKDYSRFDKKRIEEFNLFLKKK